MIPHKFEHTIAEPVGLAGVGLHSGADVSIRLLPAASGTGVVFVRTDLDGFAIPAHWKHVARVSYATSLMRQGVLLSTTEHLLSVLYAMGIDNVRIEIDNLEVPIADGSGLPFVELIRRAGVRRQRRLRRYIRVKEALEVVDGGKRIAIEPGESFRVDGGKRIAIEPGESFRVACASDYAHELVGAQRLDLELTPEVYADEIAPARTFGFERDLEAMRDMGLIRGASLENAVCFGDDGVLNPGGLRFADEPCRHKLLDLIGDLALLGRPLLGRLTAVRAGHAMHAALVGRMMNDPSCYETLTLDQIAPPALAAAG